MAQRSEERGLSARHLILVFLVGVAVCGVFFSLGFLVGYNERSSRATPETERVTSPSVVPPPINAPPDSAPAKESPAPTTPGLSESDLTKPAAGNPPVKQTESPSEGAHSMPERPSAASTKPSGTAPAGDTFAVQVTATRTKQDAETLAKLLKGRGYPVFLVAPEYAHANDNLFRVQIGPYSTREAAEKIRNKLAQEGFKPFIKH
ncbi:MAG: SPOR domain-containing protein [Acidobacteriia bacterium]|nr:SPOR domain-containing protein [Terriglobia bacterium]